MARVEATLEARPEDVFRVLSDPRCYATFVVGARKVRRFDATWPEPGTTIWHTTGVWPLVLRDDTRVVEVAPPHYLKIDAGLGPLGRTPTQFTIEPVADGHSRVVAEERPANGPLARVWNPAFDLLMALRNRRMLGRLERMAQRRAVLRESAAHEA